MKEPSVLDYVKSRLNPWQKEKVEIPADEIQPVGKAQETTLAVETEQKPLRLPWRVFLALAVGLSAQWVLEPKPQDRNIWLAVGLYAAAIVLLFWAYFVNEFSLPALPEDQSATNPQTFRGKWVLISIPLALAAFLALGETPFTSGNLFTKLNVTLWLLALAAFLRGLWLPEPDAPSFWTRLKGFLQRQSWQINLSRWTLLVLAVSALVIFFRLYNIDGVPAEPFSDHAEKLLDVYDLTQGQTHIFFERNTGREFIQFYWTALIAWVFNTGLTFLSLKLGTAFIGLLTLPYIYLLGKELGGRRVAILALLLAGVAYWPNTISRIGLRFPLYPVFVAPVLFYLLRGLRTQNRNDFILSGLFLGLGLHGYSPFRFVPFVVIAVVALYLLHGASRGMRKQTLVLFTVLVIASVFVFIPLFRYALSPTGREMFSYRALSRLTGEEQAITAPGWCQTENSTQATVCVFLQNTWNAMTMFNYDDGEIWVHSIPHRPALDMTTAVLFVFGYIFLLVRYLRQRRWQDIFLILAVPLLLMPSILSLAFPGENPSLNRAGGALVVVFVIVALALDGLYNALRGDELSSRARQGVALGSVLILLAMSTLQSYSLVFDQFAHQFRAGAWNTSDMGKVIRAFMIEGNSPDNAWVVPFPHWVDTRLVGIQSGLPTVDFALWRDELPQSLENQGNKLFIIKQEDQESVEALRQMYPDGILGLFKSPLEGKNFWIYTVPAPYDSNP